MAKPEIPSTEFGAELTRGNLKTAMAEAGAKNPHALWMVPYGQIKVIPGFNTRIRTPEYEAHIEATKESIKENGFYQDKPLTGYVALEDGQQVIYLTDGHTRHEAAGRAIDEGYSLENLPIVIKPNGTSIEDLTVAWSRPTTAARSRPMRRPSWSSGCWAWAWTKPRSPSA